MLAQPVRRVMKIERDSAGTLNATIPNADHYVFVSNRAEVERENNAFLDSLPGSNAP